MHAFGKWKAIGTLAASFCVPATNFAQEPQSTLRADVRLVTVDVTVTDKRGAIMHGLSCADFKLEEAKHPQTLRHCEEHILNTASAATPVAKPAPNVFTNASEEPLPPTWDIILLDYLNGGVEDVPRLREAAKTIVGRSQPGHRTAIFVLGDKLILLTGFTDDEGKAQALAQLPKQIAGLGVTGPDTNVAKENDVPMDGPTGIATETSGLELMSNLNNAIIYGNKVEMTIASIEGIRDYLSGLPGRKNLFWISAGFPISLQGEFAMGSTASSQSGGFSTGKGNSSLSRIDVTSQLEKLTGDLALSRVAVFPVDTTGVFNQAVATAEVSGIGIKGNSVKFLDNGTKKYNEILSKRATMDNIAEQTGGRAFYGDNDIDTLLHKAMAASTDYYTLSYIPADSAFDGKFRKFKVSTVKSGAHLAYADGYFARNTSKADTGFHAYEAAAKKVLPLSDESGSTDFPARIWDRVAYSIRRGLPASNGVVFAVELEKLPSPAAVRSNATPVAGKSDWPSERYMVNYLIDDADLTWQTTTKGKATEFHTILVAYDDRNRTLVRKDRLVKLELTAQQFAALQHKGVALKQIISLPAGKQIFVRLGVLDTGSSHLGTTEVSATELSAVAPRAQASLQLRDRPN